MLLQRLEMYDPLTGTTTRGDLELEAGQIIRQGQHLSTGKNIDDRFAGKFLLPAFFDAHTHFRLGGEMLEQLDCSDINSAEELLQELDRRCELMTAGSWIEGFGLDLARINPDLSVVNKVTASHYLFIQTHDLHSALVNQPALEKGCITAATPDPPDGRATRDEQGNPTGIISESLVWLLRQQVPSPGSAEGYRAIARATALAHSLGITAVSENATLEDAQLYRELDELGELQLQLDIWYRGGNFDRTVLTYPRMQSANINAHAVKCFVDGAFGSRSAAMYEPYLNSVDSGVLMAGEEQIREFVQEAVATGWQVVMHAIGDRAVHIALEALSAAIKLHGQGAGRHRLEHLQVVLPNDYDYMRKLEIVPSLQPVHLRHDQQTFHSYLNSNQLANCYRWQPLIERELITPFGTDWPVEKLDPLQNLKTAVTRCNPAGDGAFIPEEAFTLARALRGLTWDPAYAAGLERQRGSLKSGMTADLVVLNANPFQLPLAELDSLEIIATFRRGEQVYEKSDWS